MNSDAVRDTLSALTSPLLAVTTIHDGRANGQIAVAGLSASVLPEAPRILVALWKSNLTHNLILASRVLAVHLLPSAPEDTLRTSLDIIHTVGMRSGRDGDKLAALRWRPGATGAPILLDTLTYVEGHVVATLDGDEMTVFLADVVAGDRLCDGLPLTWREARTHLPPAWLAEFDANQQRQRAEARQRRGG